MNRVAIIGILDDGWDGLGDAARSRLGSADCVIGAARHLECVRPYLAAACELHALDGALGKVPEWVEAAVAAGKSVAVLATGDPLLHGLASHLLGKLGVAGFDILPAPSTLQLAFARWKKAWQDVAIASCHGKDAGEWFVGATPEHSLYPVLLAIANHRRVFVFLSPANDPSRLARALLTAGFAQVKLSVAERLLTPDETVAVDLPVEVAATMKFGAPAVALVERPAHEAPRFGLEDAEYMQRTPEKGLITKQEVRALVLAKLQLGTHAIVWDIGAGSGSVGLEAARLASWGHVWAIEKNAADAAIARANAVRLGIVNYTLYEGKAPEGLAGWPDPDAVFIGGSGGELAAMIRYVIERLAPSGRLVMNFITLENLATATATLKACGAAWEVVQLQASRSQPILGMHRLAAQNPVWIITAYKVSPCRVTAN